MIITRSPLAAALATRESDIRQAYRVLGRARFYRRNGDARQAALFLKIARTRIMAVRLSNLTVKFTADRINLCGCPAQCTCVAPF